MEQLGPEQPPPPPPPPPPPITMHCSPMQPMLIQFRPEQCPPPPPPPGQRLPSQLMVQCTSNWSDSPPPPPLPSQSEPTQPPIEQPEPLHTPSTQFDPMQPIGVQSGPVHTPFTQPLPLQPRLTQRRPNTCQCMFKRCVYVKAFMSSLFRKKWLTSALSVDTITT
jgi:hypothetical protein